MANVEQQLAEAFVCAKCHQQGGHVKKLAMSGTGLSRLLEFQPYRYAFVSCDYCGYTEVYDLRTLEGSDNLGAILELLFAN
jgi:predicted nucleic-acid-binding Zn-ribbon protein